MQDYQEQEEYATYIIVNNDLNMSKGKIASQVGHLTETIAERIMRIMYESEKSKEFVLDYTNCDEDRHYEGKYVVVRWKFYSHHG